ncbi:MAG: type II secretion system F family protein [Desulfurococcales archaeon]|nr:type II secretion system F family protein [Desulfurococcales archaeon]
MMNASRRPARVERLEPRPRMYVISSLILAIVAGIAYVAITGPATIKSEAHLTMELAPPPFPRLPVGPHIVRLIAFVIAAALAPLGIYSRRVMVFQRRLEEASIRVVREFLGLLRTGYSVIDAVSIMAAEDYGPLNAFIRRMAGLLKRNYTFEEAFNSSIAMLPRSARVFLIPILDAYEAGGRAVELAGSLSSVMSNINALEELRRSSLGAYTYMLITSMIMFAAVSAATVYLASSIWSGKAGFVKPLFTPGEIDAMLFYTSTWLSVIAGLIAGKLIAGTVKAGLWYAFLFYIVTVATLFGAGHLIR